MKTLLSGRIFQGLRGYPPRGELGPNLSLGKVSTLLHRDLPKTLRYLGPEGFPISLPCGPLILGATPCPARRGKFSRICSCSGVKPDLSRERLRLPQLLSLQLSNWAASLLRPCPCFHPRQVLDLLCASINGAPVLAASQTEALVALPVPFSGTPALPWAPVWGLDLAAHLLAWTLHPEILPWISHYWVVPQLPEELLSLSGPDLPRDWLLHRGSAPVAGTAQG